MDEAYHIFCEQDGADIVQGFSFNQFLRILDDKAKASYYFNSTTIAAVLRKFEKERPGPRARPVSAESELSWTIYAMLSGRIFEVGEASRQSHVRHII